MERVGARKPSDGRSLVCEQSGYTPIDPPDTPRVRSLAATRGIRPPRELPRTSAFGLLGRLPQDQGHPPHPAFRPPQVDPDNGGVLPPHRRRLASRGHRATLLKQGRGHISARKVGTRTDSRSLKPAPRRWPSADRTLNGACQCKTVVVQRTLCWRRVLHALQVDTGLTVCGYFRGCSEGS